VDDLIDLAQVLGVPTAELLPDGPSPRRSATPALLRAVAEHVDARELADELERFTVKAQELEQPPVLWDVTPSSPRDTAEALLDAAGIGQPPIDIKQLVLGCGVQILPWTASEDIDGLIVELETGTVIWVNPEQLATRQRFTLAHELGHHLLRHIDRFHVEFGGELSPNVTGEHPRYDWRAERAANDFAANLLMPASMVRAEFAKTENLGMLAQRFKVSKAAMGFRLKTLRLE
jgi:hypothetical protein